MSVTMLCQHQVFLLVDNHIRGKNGNPFHRTYLIQIKTHT